MSAWSGGAMDDVTTTVDDNDDFDALLEASSLGAPGVIAAIGTTPSNARRRFDQAARHPQSRTIETMAAAEDTDARPSGHHAPTHPVPLPKSTPQLRTSSTVTTGTGKTAAYLQYVHSVDLVVSERHGHAARTPRFCIGVSDREELLRLALGLGGQAHPWSLVLSDLGAVLPQRSAVPFRAVGPLRSRTTLGDEVAAWFADCRSLPFAPSCESLLRPFVTLGDLREGTGGPGKATADSVTLRKPMAGVRETRNALLPLCVRDDLIDVGAWVDDTCVAQDAARGGLDACLRGPAAHAALPRPAGACLSWMSASPHPKLLAWPAAGSRPWASLRAAAADLALCAPTEGGLLTRALPMAHGAETRPACQSLGKLLSWRILQPVLDQGWWHLLDDDSLKRRSECLGGKGTQFWPYAVTLSCLHRGETFQKVLWTPGPQQPSSKHAAAQGSLAAKGRPERTCETSARIAAQTVRTETVGKLHLSAPVGTLPLPTRLCYRSNDPYAVEAVFTQEDMVVSWTFARDLLTDGMQEQAGDGDVRVWPSASDAARIFIELSPPAGTALVSLPRSYVQDFLSQTTNIVPIGAEHTYISPVLHTLERQLSQLTTHPGISG